MHKTVFPLLAGMSMLALVSCETMVDVVPPTHEPRLAITYTLSTQPGGSDYQQLADSRALYVSTSQGVLSATPLKGHTDASAELRDAAGQLLEIFRPQARAGYPDSLFGYYVPTRGYVGQPGQKYTLLVRAAGVEAVQATLVLPALPTVEAASYVSSTPASSTRLGTGRLTFTVVDKVTTDDYYVAYARVLDATGKYWGNVNQDYSARNSEGPDIRLSRFDLSDQSSLYRLLPFSDASRNGQRISFSNEVQLRYSRPAGSQQPTPPAPAYLEVTVSSVPAETYAFYQSVQRYYNTEGSPFAEPAPLRTNITDGYGLFGGAADQVVRIPL